MTGVRYFFGRAQPLPAVNLPRHGTGLGTRTQRAGAL